jgi:hypothetical protein
MTKCKEQTYGNQSTMKHQKKHDKRQVIAAAGGFVSLLYH